MKQTLKIFTVATIAMFAFTTVSHAQFGLIGGVAGALSKGKKKGKEVKLASGQEIKTTLTPIGKTEVLSWADMEDETAEAGIFKAMQNGGGQPQFDREAFQKRQEAQRAAIKAILTPEQFEKYEKAEAERHDPTKWVSSEEFHHRLEQKYPWLR